MTDPKDEAQAKLAARAISLGWWSHYKTGRYLVFALSLDENTLEPLVHYWSEKNRTRWTRTVADFTEMVNVIGVTIGDVPRFTLQQAATVDEILVALGATP